MVPLLKLPVNVAMLAFRILQAKNHGRFIATKQVVGSKGDQGRDR